MSVGHKKAHGSNPDKGSRKYYDWAAIETKGRSTSALVVEAGKYNEHSSLEETIETHLIPIKSLTTRQMLRIKPRQAVETVELKGKQAEKIDVYVCARKHENVNAIKGRWCVTCNGKVEKIQKLTGRMIEVSIVKTLKLSDSTLLDRTKNFQQDYKLGLKMGSKPISRPDDNLKPIKEEESRVKDGEIALDDRDSYILGLD